MDYAQQQRNPGRHVIGITAVVLLHVLIVYALVTGLARTVVEVIKGPIDVKVIEELIKKPPPPEVVPPPKLATPPPPFTPPPEINIAAPAVLGPTITAVTPVAPAAPQAPVIQKAPEPAPVARTARAACANYVEVMSSIAYPRDALRDGLEGEVVMEFTVTASGQIKDVAIKSSTNRVFNRPSMAVVSQLSCQGQGQDVRVTAPIGFKLR